MLRATALLLFIFSLNVAAELSQNQPLYTYYSKPPFIVDKSKKTGLFYDFARHLSDNNPSIKFEIVYIPRKRLDLKLESGQLDGPILGVNPLWFGDKRETKYLWTSSIYSDTDDFVSLKTKPFEYKNLASFYNKSFAGVSGLYYVQLNELVAENKLNRLDTIGDQQVFSIVEKEWVDFGVVSRSTYRYLLKHQLVADQFYFSAIPHESFERRILVPIEQQMLYKLIQSFLQKLPEDKKWQTILRQYQ